MSDPHACPSHSPSLSKHRWLGLALALILAMGCSHPTPVALSLPSSSPTALPSATATPCVATLSVKSEPVGADLYLDDVLIGVTPLDVQVSLGPHALSLDKEGFAPANVLTDVRCGQRLEISETLRDRAAPTLVLDPLPAQVAPQDGLKIVARASDNGAVAHITLWVDGAQVQRVAEPSLRHNLDTRLLAPGPHRLRVEARDTAGHATQAEAAFEILSPQATPGTLAEPTLALAQPATQRPTSRATATLSPTPAPPAVRVLRQQISIATYAYQQALYTDPSAGHPYPLLHRDRVGPPEPKDYELIVLANRYLELAILPELGGRIYQVRYLPTGQDLLYNNKVIKPTHWGPEDQGWWLAAGGIEFCLPVTEHGYLTAQPWEATVAQHPDGSASVNLEILEASRGILAQVEIGLRPDEGAYTIVTALRNTSAQPQSVQYWVNAMLSPGGQSVGPDLRFYYPADSMRVHSRNDASLPDAGEPLQWPVHAGRDLSRYANWPLWLGIFAPDLRQPFTAVYDETSQLGLVRVFPPELAPGAKLFAFGPGWGDTAAYTDDGSRYVEMWGGLTPTFWDDATLASQETVRWSETWYPVSRIGGVSAANPHVALHVVRREGRLDLALQALHPAHWLIQVSQGDQRLVEQWVSLDPAQPHRVAAPLAGNPQAPIVVRIIDSQRTVILDQVF